MNKIEIFKPFGEAFELMKKILFQPFQFEKWLVIAFAAFLSGHFSAGGFNFNYRLNNQQAASITPPAALTNFIQEWKPWLPLIICIAVITFLAVLLVLLWIRARGQFIFTDCIVHNRAAIVAPWREYRREANSFFLFGLALAFGGIVLFAISAAIVFPLFNASGTHGAATFVTVSVLAFFVICWIALWIFVVLVVSMMPFVMYAQRCLAMDAFRGATRLVASHPWSFVLFCLFGLVLVLAMLVIGIVLTCATCCVAGLPYVGTVVMLPVFVWLRAFVLCFLRQFGPEYDVFARSTSTLEPPPLPA